MIRVYRKEGADGPLIDQLDTSDPVEAEGHYLRLCQARTNGPGLAQIVPRGAAARIVPRGAYRTDMEWLQDDGQPYREQDHDRALIFCARPDQGWRPPTPTMIRGALAAAGLSQQAAARRMGISPRQMRYYCAGEKSISWPEWRALLEWTGKGR